VAEASVAKPGSPGRKKENPDSGFFVHYSVERKVPVNKLRLACGHILGKEYELSYVVAGEKLSARLNKQFRDKLNATNILSFPLTDQSGEIVVCYDLLRREATKQNEPFEDYLLYISVHGMLHLKGYNHGPQMEKKERQYLAVLLNLKPKNLGKL